MSYEIQTVFNQIVSLIPWYEFDKLVLKYGGNYKVKSFKCKQHFLTMIFAQLTKRESLRGIEICLSSQKNKLYHMGFGNCNISRNTISNANETRDYRIYEELSLILIERAKKLYKNESVIESLNFEESIYALDSSIIRVSLSLMPWAKYMDDKNGGVKLHTLLDLKGNIPSVNIITNGRVYDGEILDLLYFEAGSIYIMDRGYVDYDRLYNIEKNKAFFITRATPGATKVTRIYSNKVDNSETSSLKGEIVYDQIIRFTTKKARKNYPDKLRRIKYKDLENKKILVFLTNNLTLKATQITQLYKKRWEIELFFKWIKQHLRIKRFYSYSMNGVKTQIWIGICSYLLVLIMKKVLKLEQSPYTILQILSVNIFERTQINQLFKNLDYRNLKDDDDEAFYLLL